MYLKVRLTCEQIISLCKARIADTCMPTDNHRAVRLSLCRQQVRHFARFVDKVLTKFPHDVVMLNESETASKLLHTQLTSKQNRCCTTS